MRFSFDEHTVDSAIRFFLYILIFWLPYSPAVVESCVIISMLLWILKRVLFTKSLKPAPSPINKPIGFFLAVCLLSILGSVFIEQSWHNFLTKTLEWFIVFFLVVETVKKREHIFIILAVLLFTSLATALDGIQQYYLTHRDIFLGRVIEPGGRATAGFKTPNGLGGYLTIIIPLLAALMFLPFKKRKTAAILGFSGLILVTVWSLAATFSRGAWIGVFLGVLLLISVFCFYKQKRYFYVVSGLLCLTTAFFLYFGYALIGSLDMEAFTRQITIPWRAGIWKDSLAMIGDKLFLGHGINTFMYLFEFYRGDQGTGPTYAHNCYIQLAVETGILGLCAFIWIIGKLFLESVKKISHLASQDRQLMVVSAGLLSGIFAFLMHSFTDTNFYTLQLSVLIWFMIGLLAAILNLNPQRRQT